MTTDLLSTPHGKWKNEETFRLGEGDNSDDLQSPGLNMQVLDPLSEAAQWDSLISGYSNATVFHSVAWAKVLSRTYAHTPLYLRFLSDEGELAALIPIMEVRSPITGRRGVSLPFSDFCPPLLGAERHLHTIRDHLARLSSERGWKHFELRGDGIASGQPPSSPTFYGHELDLTIGVDALSAACSSSVRRALRKAERSQLNVRIEHSEPAMREFYRLHCLTRRRHGLPPQPYRFFQHIHEELIGEQGFIVTASHQETTRPIAAAVFLRFRDSAIYKFGASDASEWNLRPNNLVMWHGIKQLADSGAKSLHFGRTSPDQDGLRRFKLSWGAREQPIHYHQYQTATKSWQPLIPSAPKSRAAETAHKLINHTPIPLNRLAGTLIYPHLD